VTRGTGAPDRSGSRFAGAPPIIWKSIAASIAFGLAAWFFAGGFGLFVGAGIVIIWWAFAPPRAVLWALAAGSLAAAPIALVLQGLPRTPVAGSRFGVQHLLAHRLVQVALASAAFAAIIEGLGLRPRAAERPVEQPRRLSRGRAFFARLREPLIGYEDGESGGDDAAPPGGRREPDRREGRAGE
jgi:hypothetical protein